MEILRTVLILTATIVVVSGQVTLTAFTLQNGKTAHDLRSEPIQANDKLTIIIPKLYYDGKGPDAFFMVGYGAPPVERPSKAPGHKIPNEKGNCEILKAYNGDTITLQLPTKYAVDTIDWLAMYCIAYKHTFGYVDFSKHKEDLKNLTAGPIDKSPKPCDGNQTKFSLILISISSVFLVLFNFYLTT